MLHSDFVPRNDEESEFPPMRGHFWVVWELIPEELYRTSQLKIHREYVRSFLFESDAWKFSAGLRYSYVEKVEV